MQLGFAMGLYPSSGNQLEIAARALSAAVSGIMWYVPNNLAGVFQNSGQTGAPAVGSAVGYLPAVDSANPMVQATGTNRPTLRRTSAGNHYLEFDGSSDRMGCTTANTGASGTFISVASVTTVALQSPLSSGGSSLAVPGVGLAFNATNQGRLARSDAVTTNTIVGGAYVANVPYALEGTWAPGAAELFIDGVSVANSAVAQATVSTTGIALGANSPSGGNILGGNIYFAFYAPSVLSPAQRATIRAFAQSLAQ